MKKILSIVLALAVVCGLAVTAWAASITVETDKDTVLAGEQVTVTLTLDETVSVDVGVMAWECDVYYDETLFTCTREDVVPSELYATAFFGVNSNGHYANFSYYDPYAGSMELPAGVIGTVTFTALQELNVTAAQSSFVIDMYASNNNGDMVMDLDVEVSIAVCSGHEWVEDEDKTVHATCTEAGEIHATCSVCGATKVEEEPALGHDFSDQWSIDSEDILDADGNVIGMLEHYGCWQCGQVEYSKAVYFMNLDENYNLKPGKTVEIAPGETIRYYAMGLTGYDVLIHGTDLSVKVIVPGGWISEGTEYTCEPVNGVVTIPVEGFEVFIEITNNGSAAAAYDMEVLIPIGDWTKPAELVPGSNTIILEPGHMNQYYTKFIAACDGEITFTVTGDYWRYVITNYGADKVEWEDDTYYNGQAFDDEYGDNSNTMTIPVKAGDLIEIVLDAYYVEDWEWYYPGSTLTVDVAPAYTHDGYITAVEAKDATCTEAGHIAHWICGCCGATFSDEALTQPVEDVTVPATGHTIVWTETKAPTCTEPGEETGTCHCGITETREIPATGHTFGEWTETKAPTCTEPGEETRSCACGETETREIPVIAHTFGEWTEVKAPSCTAAGEEKHVCSCGHEETREIPATGHVYGEDGTCTVCGHNPGTGDVISVVIAAAIVSALSIVALPLVKKHF